MAEETAARILANLSGYSDLLDSPAPPADNRCKMEISTLKDAFLERNGWMRVPRITALLLTLTCCLSGCCSFSSTITTDHAWVAQKGSVSQKGGVVQKGHVHQKGVSQKGGKSTYHQDLWNHYEPTACCDNWDPILGSCNACGVCGGDCHGHTPAQHLKHMLTCASGCGEIYWGEWISDPPDDCDPCDDWGNWTGPTDCYGPSCLDTLASGWCNLFGFRNGGGKGKGGCDSCGSKGGCDSCGGATETYYESAPEMAPGEVVPTPTIEGEGPTEPAARGTSRFSFRSTRLTR